MGTRADFYVRNEQKKPKMDWVGSIAFDGYECDDVVLQSSTEEVFRQEVAKMLNNRDDSTFPEHGWPWPWADSRTTDYSYIFVDGKVMGSCFGYPLFDPLIPLEEREDKEDETQMEGYFPDMSHIKNVRFDQGSGLLIISEKPTND